MVAKMLFILVPILTIPTFGGIVLLWLKIADFNVISFGVGIVQVYWMAVAIFVTTARNGGYNDWTK